MADWLLGSSRHFLGEQAVAKQHFQDGFGRPATRNSQQFGLDYRVRALITFARVLWLSGTPDKAMAAVREAIAEAIELRKPFSICFAMVYAVPVFLWCGDFRTAQELLDRLTKQPNWHALPSLHATASALQGLLDLQRGDAERAVASLRASTEKMRLDRQMIILNVALGGLAEGLAKLGRSDEAFAVLADTLAGARRDGDALELPELLRMRAEMLMAGSGPVTSECEDCLMESLACARRQSALAWELRTAMTLARLRWTQGRGAEGLSAFATVHARFGEGFETMDLKAAALLPGQLGAAS
jgi:predicted ATPase